MMKSMHPSHSHPTSTPPLTVFVQICGFISPSLSLSGASTDNLPPGVLYKVKASYKYQAEDVDELNFEVGEIMHVVQYDDPEEQVRFIRNSLPALNRV